MALWPLLISATGVSAGFLALLAAGLLLQWYSKIKAILAIPSPPGTHWLLGHPGILDGCEKAPWRVHEFAKQLGRIFRLRVAHLHVVIVTDPAEVLRLTSRGEHYLDKAPELYVEAFNMMHGDRNAFNLVSLPTGPEWRTVRKATSPIFAGSRLKAALPTLLGIVDSITRQWEAAGSSRCWDLNDVCKRIALEAISGWGFDTDLHAVRDLSMPHPVGTLVDDAAHAVHTVLMDPIYKLKPWSKVVRKGLRDLKEYDKWMQGFTRQLLERKDTLPSDCIGRALLDLQLPSPDGKQGMGMKQLVSNVAIFIAAGYETTANAMTITLLLLLRHPEWLRRVEAELDAAGLLKTPARRQPRELTSADLSQLPILNAVIKESLRMLPPVGLGSFRCTKVDTQVCGYTVPAGCMVVFPLFAIDNARWSYGDDAEEFRPDRWLAKGAVCWDPPPSADQATQQVHLHASAAGQPQLAGSPAAASDAARPKEPYAFSTGPRDCVGQALGRLELQVFLAVLLSRFRLQLAPSMGTPQQAMDSLIYHITFKAGNGMWVTAEAR